MGTAANSVVKGAGDVEFGLRWGIGWVKSVSTPEKRHNGRVEFIQDGFKHPSAGSVEIRRQTDLIATLKEAEGKDTVYFAFRLESHRDDKVDKATPFSELAKADNNTELLHSRLVTALPFGTPEAEQLLMQCEAEAATGIVGAVEVANAPIGNGSRTVANEPSGNQLPGESWEFAAAMGCVDLAFEGLSSLGEPFSMATLTSLSQVFLHAADEAQTAFSGRLNRGGRAHTRARGAIRTAIKRYPIPAANATEEEYHTWEALLVKTTTRLMSVAQDILARAQS